VLRSTLRFLALTALICYAALACTVALIVLLSGGGIWAALLIGISFPLHFLVSLVSM
jgi:hypothetical protein